MSEELTKYKWPQVLPVPPHKRIEICDYIRQGHSEDEACALAVVSTTDYGMDRDPQFVEMVLQARKDRGDHWVGEIMKSAKTTVSKDEAPGEKIKFEKLKWLAKIDNPDKYGEKTTTDVNINHSISYSMKKMTIEEAKQILNDDPFSKPLEAEFTPIEDKEFPL